jgi:nicotinic acetylcholine receptor, invertebrate
MLTILLCAGIHSVICLYEMQVTENLTQSKLLGYDDMIRPSEKVIIAIQPELLQILSINEKDQVMLSSINVYMSWIDDRLSWDKNATNVSKISIPANKLWKPDLYVLNAVDSDGFVSINDRLTATIHYTGSVEINLPMTSLTTRCTLDVRYFPFDNQTCEIVVTNWNLDSDQHAMIPMSSSVVLKGYEENSLWDLTGSYISGGVDTSVRSTQYDTFFTKGALRLYLKRKPLYIIINGIVPAIVLNIINLISFFLPFTEQIALTITCFLTFTVNLVIVNAEIPVQSDCIPTIIIYFQFSMVYTLITLFWFTFLNNCSTLNRLPFGLKYVTEFPGNLTRFFSKNKVLTIDKINANENSEEEKKAEFEKKITRLNYYFLTLFFIFMLISLLCIFLRV